MSKQVKQKCICLKVCLEKNDSQNCKKKVELFFFNHLRHVYLFNTLIYLTINRRHISVIGGKD